MRRCLRSDDDVILPEPSTDLSALIGDDQQDAEEVSGCNASTCMSCGGHRKPSCPLKLLEA